MLDGWGAIEKDYFVARGNHDRSMAGTAYDTCTAVPDTSPQHFDCWGDTFPYPLRQLQKYELGGLRLIGLDTTMLDAAGGTMSAAQLHDLADVLHHDKHQPTLLFGHHPVTYESAATTEAGPAFDIDRPTAIALQRLYEQTPGVFFHHPGYTHRNKRTFLLDQDQSPIQSVEFLEVGRRPRSTRTAPRWQWPGASAAATSTTPSIRTTCWARSPTATTRSSGTCPDCAPSAETTPGRRQSRARTGSARSAHSSMAARQDRPRRPGCLLGR